MRGIRWKQQNSVRCNLFTHQRWTSMCRQRWRQPPLPWADFGVRMLSSGALMVLFGPGLDTQEEQPRIPPTTTWETIAKRSRLTMILSRSHIESFWIFFGRATSQGKGLGRVNTKRRSSITMKSKKGWLRKAGLKLQLPWMGRSTLRLSLLLPFTWPRIIIRSIACGSRVISSRSSKPCIQTWRIW